MSSPTATAPAPARPAINPKFIVPFVNSARNVFTTMVGVPTDVQKPFAKDAHAASYDVSGVIGFSGEVVGSVVVSFQMAAAVKLVSSFAGMPIEAGSADFTDAIGELANMIVGSAKKDLGATASITVPSVIIGTGHVFARLSDVPCIVIPCTTAVGNFAVEVSIKHVKA